MDARARHLERAHQGEHTRRRQCEGELRLVHRRDRALKHDHEQHRRRGQPDQRQVGRLADVEAAPVEGYRQPLVRTLQHVRQLDHVHDQRQKRKHEQHDAHTRVRARVVGLLQDGMQVHKHDVVPARVRLHEVEDPAVPELEPVHVSGLVRQRVHAGSRLPDRHREPDCVRVRDLEGGYGHGDHPVHRDDEDLVHVCGRVLRVRTCVVIRKQGRVDRVVHEHVQVTRPRLSPCQPTRHRSRCRFQSRTRCRCPALRTCFCTT